MCVWVRGGSMRWSPLYMGKNAAHQWISALKSSSRIVWPWAGELRSVSSILDTNSRAGLTHWAMWNRRPRICCSWWRVACVLWAHCSVSWRVSAIFCGGTRIQVIFVVGEIALWSDSLTPSSLNMSPRRWKPDVAASWLGATPRKSSM